MSVEDYWSLKQYSPRSSQYSIIEGVSSILDDENIDNIIVEAGTGIGKSAIATTIANMVDDSYILTRTKQLQNQYLNDFDYMLTEIKGRSNYICNFLSTDEITVTCDNCVKTINKEKPCPDCSYLYHRTKALKSKNVLANYHYLYNASKYNDKWSQRELIVFDEAHKLEEFIMSAVTLELNREYCKKHFEIDIFSPIINGDSLEEWKSTTKWIPIFENLIHKCLKKASKHREELEFTTDEKEIIKLSKKITTLENKANNYNWIKNVIVKDNWVVILPRKYEIEKGLNVQATFKPITVQKYTSDILKLGEKRLFLTGTIGDFNKFCEWLNIDPARTSHISQESNFPITNRPIHRKYIKDMRGFTDGEPNWKTVKALETIRNIVENHKGQKGVIHTTSHQQTEWLIKNLPELPLIRVTSDKKSNRDLTREEVISQFKNSLTGILIGAGIKDGVDFKNDECRFQILFKVPIPRFDAQVQARNRKDKIWVPYQAIMDTVQAYGRGVRSETDYCTFYVLDKYLDVLLFKYPSLFTSYFKEAII